MNSKTLKIILKHEKKYFKDFEYNTDVNNSEIIEENEVPDVPMDEFLTEKYDRSFLCIGYIYFRFDITRKNSFRI